MVALLRQELPSRRGPCRKCGGPRLKLRLNGTYRYWACEPCLRATWRKVKSRVARGAQDVRHQALLEEIARDRADGRVKRCAKCDTPKAFALFAKSKASADGLWPYCRACDSERWRNGRTRAARITARAFAAFLGGCYAAWCANDDRNLNYDLECLWWQRHWRTWGECE